MSTKIFYGIDELVTLKGVAQKKGRYLVEKDLSIISDAAFVTENGIISWIGKSQKIPKAYSNKKSYHLKGSCVIPGFVECHTHLIFAGDRSDEFELRNRGATYQEIADRGGGILKTVRETRKSSSTNLLHLSQDRVDRFVKQGVTTLEIKSGYGLNKKDELKMLKVAHHLKGPQIVPTFLGAHDFPPEGKEGYLESLRRMLPLIKKNNLCERVDIFIEKNYFSIDEAKDYLTKALKLGFKFSCHVEQLSHQGGTRLALQLGASSADHLVQIDERDIEALSKSEITCVLLPTADFYLKMKYPPARALIDHGARVALATDFNPGSSPTQDLSLVGVLSRMMMQMTQVEVLAAYTYSAAAALGIEQRAGSLEVGKNGDFVILPTSWKNLFYQVGYHPINSVWRNGKKIYNS